MDSVKYWPFEVLPPAKQTDHHRQVVAYLSQALAEGFQSYVFDKSNYGASATNGRTGEMIHRGVNRYWEVILRIADDVIASCYVDGFTDAADATLEWLRGKEATEILDQFKRSIIPAPGIQRE